jgi:SAM-dependent methyltransferase
VNRAERERKAYDEDGVFQVSDGWHRRFPHVFSCANTRGAEQRFEGWLTHHAKGCPVLELGCGDGGGAQRLLELGAASVKGIDLSASMIEKARSRALSGATFAVADVSEPLDGRFGLIWGRAILHHLDWRPMLRRWYRDNLEPGGALVFYEPLGDSPLLRLYWRLARGAHTPDEEALHGADLAFLRAEFPAVELWPVNLLSLPMGLVSSKLFASGANRVMAVADQVDRAVARLAPQAHRYFRQLLIKIVKPPLHEGAVGRAQRLTSEGG